MGGCGISGLMYGKVEACDFLCHPYAADLIMLSVEVLSKSLEARPTPCIPALCPTCTQDGNARHHAHRWGAIQRGS